MLPNPKETADLVKFTEQIFDRKLHFFVQCLVSIMEKLATLF